MAEADRRRLLQRALELPIASDADFSGERRPPTDADPALLKVIDDTALRTKLVDSHLAEGLQSPKGPQKIASIVRIYPNFDAPARHQSDKRVPPRPRSDGRVPGRAAPRAPARDLPSVEAMEQLIARIHELEAAVAHELSAQIDDRIDLLKRMIANATGDELEASHRELGEALAEKRALAGRIRLEAFRRIESDVDFAPRAHLRLLAR